MEEMLGCAEETKATAKDYASGQEVKWCPGCGSFSILSTLQQVLAGLGQPKEKHVFISGIGCSSRTPYYLNTYGFHTLHGRALPVATGVKLANPELTVWVATGDGDALSIGGNHFLHALRRNVNLKVLLFNNRIYGLTKGQASPTSERGKVTKSSPMGTVESPVNPVALALATGATFVARSLAIDRLTLTDVLNQAAAHQGSAFIEILQSCVVFNDGAFDELWDKETREQMLLPLRPGEPLLFGPNKSKVVSFDGYRPVVKDAAGVKDPAVFNSNDASLAGVLSQLMEPDYPLPVGVLYKDQRPTFDAALHELIDRAKAKKPTLSALFNEGETWDVA